MDSNAPKTSSGESPVPDLFEATGGAMDVCLVLAHDEGAAHADPTENLRSREGFAQAPSANTPAVCRLPHHH